MKESSRSFLHLSTKNNYENLCPSPSKKKNKLIDSVILGQTKDQLNLIEKARSILYQN